MKQRLSKTALIALLVVVMPVMALAGGGCDAAFGSDAPAIIKVQSSWGPAERAMAAGHYARALRELHATMPALRSIRKPFMRRCVAGGAGIRIAAARAGLDYIQVHPGDLVGAKKAANHAWIAFPMADNCP